MVTSPEAMQSPAGATPAELTASMEAHAGHGDWERVEEVAAKLRAAVMQVPEDQRREVIIAVQRSMEKVLTQAQDARADVTGKLAAIRRGRDATAAYGSANGTEQAPAGGHQGP